MDRMPDIVPIRDRRYAEIPIDKIKVINSRSRDQEQFDMNVKSIDAVGLLKPIRVNDKFVERTELYELICGEGRLLAHQRLGRQSIVAEVVTCTRKEAYLQSLVENLARTKPDTMEYARELKRLHDEGWDFKQIAVVAVKEEWYVRDYIRLVAQGEERLIRGVEQGVFPIKFAVKVAATDDSQIQNVLMDAFDVGLVTTANFAQARKIISTRAREHKQRQAAAAAKYTVGQLQQDIVDVTKAKASYVREAQTKENRFMTLLAGINTLWKDEGFLQLLREEKLLQRPDLAGDFRYEP
jgi:ParB family transcriptional regulator, chromosome partitioning protein